MQILLAALALLGSLLPARGQEPEIHHHPGMSTAVDRFYSTWYMPDDTRKSCCNKQDCYPTKAKFEKGQWWALRREDHKFIPVPWSKVERNRDNPDGRNHLCAPAPNTYVHAEDTVFCFALGDGT